MKTVKNKKAQKLSISNKKVSVPPPSGYHWMEEGGRYYLMEGEYQPQEGAVEKAKLKVVTHPKKCMLGMVVGPMAQMAGKVFEDVKKSM